MPTGPRDHPRSRGPVPTFLHRPAQPVEPAGSGRLFMPVCRILRMADRLEWADGSPRPTTALTCAFIRRLGHNGRKKG